MGKCYALQRHPLFDGVCGVLFFIILLAHLFAIIVPTCWHSCQYVSMMADGIANFFFVGCDRCYCHCSSWKPLKPLRCYNGRCFLCQCGKLWPFYEMADDVVIVADGIVTFLLWLMLLSLWRWNSHIVR